MKDRVHPLHALCLRLHGSLGAARVASRRPRELGTARVPGMEALAKRIADVAPQRALPRFASRSF